LGAYLGSSVVGPSSRKMMGGVCRLKYNGGRLSIPYTKRGSRSVVSMFGGDYCCSLKTLWDTLCSVLVRLSSLLGVSDYLGGGMGRRWEGEGSETHT
jgi:hypothetical protein